jgi:hypothetical protein
MIVRSRRYAGGIEVALPIEDLVREAFAALSRDDLDWLQRQYLAQDIRCHFPGVVPWPGTYLRCWSSLAGPSSSQAAHSGLEVRDVLANDERAVALATVHAERARPATGTPWRLISHITDGKPTEAWRKS